jgi:hypothetical protein
LRPKNASLPANGATRFFVPADTFPNTGANASVFEGERGASRTCNEFAIYLGQHRRKQQHQKSWRATAIFAAQHGVSFVAGGL